MGPSSSRVNRDSSWTQAVALLEAADSCWTRRMEQGLVGQNSILASPRPKDDSTGVRQVQILPRNQKTQALQ